MPSGMEIFLPFMPSTLLTRAKSPSKLFLVKSLLRVAVSRRWKYRGYLCAELFSKSLTIYKLILHHPSEKHNHIDGLMQERHNSSLSCIKSSIYEYMLQHSGKLKCWRLLKLTLSRQNMLITIIPIVDLKKQGEARQAINFHGINLVSQRWIFMWFV